MPRKQPLYAPIFVPNGRYVLAGGWRRFDEVCVQSNGVSDTISAHQLPPEILQRLTSPRAPLCGLAMNRPKVMGILNVTPDSFSDGGKFDKPDAALHQVAAMCSDGADIIDIGGESTRPGADFVEVEAEIDRTAPVIAAIRAKRGIPVSIDTRKSAVARAAISAGADLINDVSAFAFDPDMAQLAHEANTPVCLMHAQGLPKTMQENPSYDDVVHDVLMELESRVVFAQSKGLDRSQITVDPGIGFGKNLDHNLHLLRNLSAFHVLGCPILLGASRKKFIGTLSDVETAEARMPGSVTVALHGLAHGVQITRVHDVAQTVQAFKMWMALNG